MVMVVVYTEFLAQFMYAIHECRIMLNPIKMNRKQNWKGKGNGNGNRRYRYSKSTIELRTHH